MPSEALRRSVAPSYYIDQPITARDHRSITAARDSQLSSVRNYVISNDHFWFDYGRKSPISAGFLIATEIPTAARYVQHPAHHFDAGLCVVFINKDILHLRHFAKYVTAFWKMAGYSACSVSWCLSRTISAACSLSRSEDVA